METLDCPCSTRCCRIQNPSAHDMTVADLRDAFHLLDSALSLLRRDRCQTPEQLRRELSALSLEFDLLRLRLGQPAAEEQRN